MAVFTMEQYEAIAAAYATGELRVQYSDRSVQYRNLAEMERIMYRMEVALGINSGQTRKTLNYDKGICNASSNEGAEFDANYRCG